MVRERVEECVNFANHYTVSPTYTQQQRRFLIKLRICTLTNMAMPQHKNMLHGHKIYYSGHALAHYPCPRDYEINKFCEPFFGHALLQYTQCV